MANTKDTTLKYVNKDFSSFKRDLMRYAQAHFSGSFQDFNETSPGMMLLELQAYIGDVLAYYMDQQFLEIRQDTARQIENVENFAKMRGYKPKGPAAARVPLHFMLEVPASATSDGRWVPHTDYLPTLSAGSQAAGPNGVLFETLEDLDFSVSTPQNPLVYMPSKTDVVGTPTYFAVKRWVDAVAGRTVTETLTVGDFTPFKRVQLGEQDVQEVLDVYDREGQKWYEVDYLAQNVVFDQVTNTGSDSDIVPYVLKWRSASRRFVVDKSVANNVTYLQFGSGQGLSFDDELVPDLANLAMPVQGRPQFSTFVLDPQNFLKTRTLGLSPYNTTLTVRYRVGGGEQTNVPVRSISKIQGTTLSFKKTIGPGGLDATTAQRVRSTLEVINLVASEGGGAAETISEIKVNASSYFAAQARAVTAEDFLTHILSMPSRFGRPAKAYIKHSDFNPFGVDVHVLSLDSNGNFQTPSETLRQNIKTYLGKLRMMTEGITILSANVVNLGVRFGVVVSPRHNRSEVVANCIIALKSYFANSNMQIGMPIVRSDVESVLQGISGVISVYKLDFELKYGTPYSDDINFDVAANTRHGIIYSPPDSIFEVRFPDSDIMGESK